MIFVIFIIVGIWLYVKYNPKIDILEKEGKEYLILWYNDYKDPTNRKYYILF